MCIRFVVVAPTLAQGHVLGPFVVCWGGEGEKGVCLCAKLVEQGRREGGGGGQG